MSATSAPELAQEVAAASCYPVRAGAAAAAYVWLPPGYFAMAHAHLPVLLMLSGWPGDVTDWVRAC